MPIDVILTIFLVGFFLVGGFLIAMYYVLRVLRNIKQHEVKAGEALDNDLLFSQKNTKQEVAGPFPAEDRILVPEDADADPYADTMNNVPVQAAAIEATPAASAISSSPEEVDSESEPELKGQNEDRPVLSAMEELGMHAREGDPVAGAIWRIYQAGQLEYLDEYIPLGTSYSPARAIRITDGSRWVVLPPHHPDDILGRLSGDCDAFIVFPDGQSAYIATPLGQQLVQNIFRNDN